MRNIVQPPAGAERIAKVKDPSLSAYQRRYFTQPATGPGRRAFTAAGAAKQHRRNRRPSLFARFKRKWDEAVDTRERVACQRRLKFQPSLTLYSRDKDAHQQSQAGSA